MSSRLIPKKLTTGIVVSDTEDLEATDASDRALTSALSGALPSMPTLKVDERPWLSLSVPVRDVDDESQSQEQHTYKQYSDAHGPLRLYPDGRKNRAQMRSGTALPQHNFQMASHVPPNVALPYTDVIETATVLKRPSGVSRRPATESQPNTQMWYKRYRAAGTWRRVDGKQRAI